MTLNIDLNLIYLGGVIVLSLINFIVLILNIIKARSNFNEKGRLKRVSEQLNIEQTYLDKLYSKFHKDRAIYLNLTKQLEERQRREMERKREALKNA